MSIRPHLERPGAAALVLLVAMMALPSIAWAQFVQQGGKLAATDAVGEAHQGTSVALSSDGNTAIVGAPFDNVHTGAAWVWTRAGGVWTQGAKLVGTGADGQMDQGAAVALSGDGNTALVGGPYASAVWVFTRSG